ARPGQPSWLGLKNTIAWYGGKEAVAYLSSLEAVAWENPACSAALFLSSPPFSRSSPARFRNRLRLPAPEQQSCSLSSTRKLSAKSSSTKPSPRTARFKRPIRQNRSLPAPPSCSRSNPEIWLPARG